MRSAITYRVSGNALMFAGLLWAIGTVLAPRGPMNTLAQVTPMVGPLWVAGYLVLGVAAVVWIPGIVALYKHFVEGEQETWALAFVTVGVVGMTVTLITTVLVALAVPNFVRLASASPQPTSFEPAFAVLGSAIGSLIIVAPLLNWIALLLLSVAMMPDRAWPRTIVWGAMVCAVVEAIGPFLLVGHYTLPRLLLLLGFMYVIVLGGYISRLGRVPKPEAAAPQPKVGTGA